MLFLEDAPQGNISKGPAATASELYAANRDDQLYANGSIMKSRAVRKSWEDKVANIEKVTGERLSIPAYDGVFMPVWGGIDPEEMAAYQKRAMADYIQTTARIEELAKQHPEHYDKWMLDPLEAGRAVSRAADQRLKDVSARNQSWLNSAAGFAGGFVGGMQDPVNLGLAPFGAGKAVGQGAYNILRAGVVNGLIGAVGEAAIQPMSQRWRKEAGLKYGLGEAATNVGFAFAFGFGIDAGGRTLFRGGKMLKDKMQGKPSQQQADAFYSGLKGLDEAGSEAQAYEIIEQAASHLPDNNPLHKALLGKDYKSLVEAVHHVDPERAAGLEASRADLGHDTADIVDDELRGAANWLEGEDGRPDVLGVHHADDAAAEMQTARHVSQRDEPPAVMPRRQAEEGVSLQDGAIKPLAETGMIDGKAYSSQKVRPSSIETDAKAFQFKEGGDETGVTERLKGVKNWNPMASGKAVIFQRKTGQLVIADGHQRLGLAKRLEQQDNIELDAFIFKESDGWTPAQVRALAAKKNIQEATGTALDYARIMRDQPELLDGSVPQNSAKMTHAKGLANLSDDAFGLVINEIVPANHAALVGRLVADQALHVDVLQQMAKADLGSEAQARIFIGQALQSGTHELTQMTLFGTETTKLSLLPARTKILADALKNFKQNKRLLAAINANASEVEAVGNRVNKAANEKQSAQSGQLAELIEKLASSHGPVSDALQRAAHAMAHDDISVTKARKMFMDDIEEIYQKQGLEGLINPHKVDEPQIEPGSAEAEKQGDLLGQNVYKVSDRIAQAAADLDMYRAQNKLDDLLNIFNHTDKGLSDEIKQIIARRPSGVDIELGGDIGSVQGRRIDASWDNARKLIRVAMHNADPAAKLRHEEIHALRDLGLFTQREWKSLIEAGHKSGFMDEQLGGVTRRSLYERAYADRDNIAELLDQEVVAHLAERRKAGEDFGQQVNTIVDKLLDFLRKTGNALRGMGFQTAEDVFARIESGEIGRRAAKVQEIAQKPVLNNNDLAFALDVYHGTPHEFERFDIAKIGSGSGVQQYGHGLYFAATDGMARHFKEALGKRAGKEGVLYKARLDFDDAELLVWEEKISDSSIAEKLLDVAQKHDLDIIPEMPSRVIYQKLSAKLGSKAKASAALKDGSIPGIKYWLNHIPMTDRTPDRAEYVVFDDSLIKITEINGQAIQSKTPRDIIESVLKDVKPVHGESYPANAPKAAEPNVTYSVSEIAARRAEKTKEIANKPVISNADLAYSLDVYHGTPHQFDKFDYEQIGGGEGTQYQGYGFYFTESKDVARWYQKNLTEYQRGKKFFKETISGDDDFYFLEQLNDFIHYGSLDKDFFKIKMEDAHYFGIGNIIEKYLDKHYPAVKKASDDYLAAYDKKDDLAQEEARLNEETEIALEHFAENSQALKDLRAYLEQDKGSFYKTSVNVNKEDLLDWWGFVSEQPGNLQKIINRIIKEHDLKLPDKYSTHHKGFAGLYVKNVYEALSQNLGDDIKASAVFREYGLPGIRFLDKNKHDEKLPEAWNYVIFDDNLIEVTSHNAKGVPEGQRKTAAQIKQEAAAYENRRFNKTKRFWQKKRTETQIKDRTGSIAYSIDPEAKVQTDTPEFKAWFGESKVTDEQGKPLVVYHGAINNFDHFDAEANSGVGGVSWFTDRTDIADTYAGRGAVEGGQIYPVYLNMKKPLVIDGDNISKGLYSKDATLEDALSHAMRTQLFEDEPTKMEAVLSRLKGRKAASIDLFMNEIVDGLKVHLKNKNFDGIVLKNIYDTGDSFNTQNQYATLDPTQIKSAIGNRGTFDTKDPRITYSIDPDKALEGVRKALKEADENLGKRSADEQAELDRLAKDAPWEKETKQDAPAGGDDIDAMLGDLKDELNAQARAEHEAKMAARASQPPADQQPAARQDQKPATEPQPEPAAEKEPNFKGTPEEQAAKRKEYIEQKRRAVLTLVAAERVKADLLRHKNAKGQFDVVEAALSHIENYGIAKHSAISQREKVILGQAMAKMQEFALEFERTKITGQTPKGKMPLLHDIIREAFGESTGNLQAEKMAKAWFESHEELRQLFNRAGGMIGKMEKWGLPQNHSQQAVSAVTFKTWAGDIAPLLDRDKIVNPVTGLAHTDEQWDGMLKHIYETIITDGMNTKQPSVQTTGKGALYRQGSEARFLHFKDADSWLQYAEKYGNTAGTHGADLGFHAMMRHLSGFSRDIAAMEILGPNPDAMLNYMRGLIDQQLGFSRLGEASALPVDGTDENGKPFVKRGFRKMSHDVYVSRGVKKLEEHFDIARGVLDSPVDQQLADWGKTLRNWEVATKLGSATLSAIGDIATFKAALKFAGMKNQQLIIKDIFKYIQAEDRHFANRSGLILDSAMSMIHTESRFGGAVEAATRTGKFADRTLAWSGLTAWTQAIKHAFGMETMANFARVKHLPFDQLDKNMKRLFDNYGLSAKQWDLIRAVEATEHKGLVFLRGVDVSEKLRRTKEFFAGMQQAEKKGLLDYYNWSPQEGREDWHFMKDLMRKMQAKGLYKDGNVIANYQTMWADMRAGQQKYMEIIHAETEYAVPSGTVASQAITKSFQPGTVKGEAWRLFFQFKAYPISILMMQGGRTMRLVHGEGKAEGAAYAGSTFIAMTLAGGVVGTWLKDLKAGRDPDMDFTSQKNWGRWMAQGGGIGIMGDFLFSDHNRFGGGPLSTFAGPAFGDVEKVLKATAGNAQKLLSGKETSLGKDALGLLRSNSPGIGSLWYTATAYNRVLLDQLNYLADPAASKSFKRRMNKREREYGQQYFWPLGDTAPSRSPSVSSLGETFSLQ